MANVLPYRPGFEVLTPVVMKGFILWDNNGRFGETYHLLLHGRRISQARNQRENACHLLYVGFFLGLFSDREDGGDKFRRNVGSLSKDYTASHLRS